MAVSRRRRRSSASIKSSLRLFGRAARRRCVAVLALRRRRRGNSSVPRAGFPALQPPGRSLDAFAFVVPRRLLRGTVAELDAEPAARPAGTAAVGAQREALDQHRVLDLLQLDRRVAYVALADRDRGGFAVFVRTPAPAAAEDVHQQEAAAVALAKAADRHPAHAALVRGGDALGQGRGERLQDA